MAAPSPSRGNRCSIDPNRRDQRPSPALTCSRLERPETVAKDEGTMRDENVSGREFGQASQAGSKPHRSAGGLQPRVRTDPQLATAAAEHRIAKDEHPMLPQPEGDLVSPLHLDRSKRAEELILIVDLVVNEIRRATIRIDLGPHLHPVTTRSLSNASLMPVTGANDPQAVTPITQQAIERLPVLNERIDQHQSLGDRDDPPRDTLVPAVLSAFGSRRPFRGAGFRMK